MTSATLAGKLLDLDRREVRGVVLTVVDGVIASIDDAAVPADALYLAPGFVDAHVHVESSMVTPREFGRHAAAHGTVAAVCDPHEIANVLGADGIRYMVRSGLEGPIPLVFEAPSCVPATCFETSGATLDARAVEELFAEGVTRHLGEVMNYPGVLAADPDLVAKIAAARGRGMVVDGHAPGLVGSDVARYAAAGIATDHECTSPEEAFARIEAGMYVAIREGSAARDLAALLPVLAARPDRCLLCSDDKHPDDLVATHIDGHVRRAIAAGLDPFDVWCAASRNAVDLYGLGVGRLRVGDPADLLILSDLTEVRIRETWIRGQAVARDGHPLLPYARAVGPNRFAARPPSRADLDVTATGGLLRVIDVRDGSLLTGSSTLQARVVGGLVVPDPERDLARLVVSNRYAPAPPAVAFVRGFGLGRAAIASSVAHDSHNVIAVGGDDDALLAAMGAVIEARGGIAIADAAGISLLPLPIAGLMSPDPLDTVAAAYARLDARAHAAGSPLRAPFMTLAFLSLPVIPDLKLTDLGLFDVTSFRFTDLIAPLP